MVKPMYFKRMHYKVKKLTGFDRERLAAGVSFPEALAQFRAWCGDDVTFLTWGCDDQGILEQNIIIHDLDWDWIAGWINLQLIYNLQTDGDRNQKSLATAMEHFAIEQTRIAHDALGDAYNTALVCTHLNMEKGLADYHDAAQKLTTRLPKEHHGENSGPDPDRARRVGVLCHEVGALRRRRVRHALLPAVQRRGALQQVGQPGRPALYGARRVPTDGKLLVRLKFRKADDCTWSATRLTYQATDSMESYYKAKAASRASAAAANPAAGRPRPRSQPRNNPKRKPAAPVLSTGAAGFVCSYACWVCASK